MLCVATVSTILFTPKSRNIIYLDDIAALGIMNNRKRQFTLSTSTTSQMHTRIRWYVLIQSWKILSMENAIKKNC